MDSVVDANTRYYHRFNEKNLFVGRARVPRTRTRSTSTSSCSSAATTACAATRCATRPATRALLATLEERYFTDWFPWRLFRVGGAVFVDVGRMWGQAPLARASRSAGSSDVGFGLRIGNARSGIGNVLHIDLAFPLGAPSDISSMQVLIEAEKSF